MQVYLHHDATDAEKAAFRAHVLGMLDEVLANGGKAEIGYMEGRRPVVNDQWMVDWERTGPTRWMLRVWPLGHREAEPAEPAHPAPGAGCAK